MKNKLSLIFHLFTRIWENGVFSNKLRNIMKLTSYESVFQRNDFIISIFQELFLIDDLWDHLLTSNLTI